VEAVCVCGPIGLGPIGPPLEPSHGVPHADRPAHTDPELQESVAIANRLDKCQFPYSCRLEGLKTFEEMYTVRK
jgi:hypothetical protein